ncbi:MAG TPA: polysaccharide biosynthesis/export family protein [Candidatus Obscuribacter sp.]|nr:polysaccharide biosynthesis/export family protein [Candidatus Obscuribacter sp.]
MLWVPLLLSSPAILADSPLMLTPSQQLLGNAQTTPEIGQITAVPTLKSGVLGQQTLDSQLRAPPVAAGGVSPSLPAISNVFGANLFSGAFSQIQFSGFNPDYQISVGDIVKLRMWGAFSLDVSLAVDPQGNIFIPNVGPVNVLGVRNGELNAQIEARIKKVFRANTGVYVSLESAQPVKVYVTGFVRKPGLYGGLSSDSILYYLDKAGGVDLDRGSFLDISVQRGGALRARFDLYKFMLNGRIDSLQLHDGDTVVVGPRRYTVTVSGEVLNPFQFELHSPDLPASEVLALAKLKPNATHLSIVRRHGTERRGEYYSINDLNGIRLVDGDEVNVTADKYPGTILVRVEGAHLGEHALVLPYGAKLREALQRIKVAPQANFSAVQLFRKSVAERQKVMLDASLRGLETTVLTARSDTSEEAILRGKEAELVMQFVQRARDIQPRGQVLLANNGMADDALLEDGDIINIPEISNLVMVHGEVLFPNAIIFDSKLNVEDYIRQAGGYTQQADKSRVVMMHQDGHFADDPKIKPRAGDEIMVLPKVQSKNIEITRGISQIIYQIAVAAKVVFGL